MKVEGVYDRKGRGTVGKGRGIREGYGVNVAKVHYILV
jgi:hypothetical protein